MKETTFKLYGMDWRIFTFFSVIVLISACLNIIPNQFIGGIAVMFTLVPSSVKWENGFLFGTSTAEAEPCWRSWAAGFWYTTI